MCQRITLDQKLALHLYLNIGTYLGQPPALLQQLPFLTNQFARQQHAQQFFGGTTVPLISFTGPGSTSSTISTSTTNYSQNAEVPTLNPSSSLIQQQQQQQTAGIAVTQRHTVPEPEGSTVISKNDVVMVKVLLQYLGKVDKTAFKAAKKVCSTWFPP